ncbi:PH domain-containing protein [Microbacterium sp. CFBP9034]|uniref:PH domain-containing protein n=1 Tax=Microbacterium sp. CFBP9034 TaxID=3096540 RepID=UPI002A6A9E3B|nr:PH domain-containing protein [Microbacterium sp. CFBP9034]MDY0911137.1 PH domain-containing protein [Microbacterium sp. CFBP9034]
MPEPVTFRPRGGQILAWVAIGICALGLVYIAVTDGVASLVVWAWPIVLVAWLAWILYVRPYVRIHEGFIEIGNVFRTHRVPWGDVADVDSRYALTIHTTGGRSIRAWAAPAPGARQAMTTRRDEVARTPGEGDTRRPADAEGTASGDATALVRRTLEEFRRRGGDTLPGGTASTLNVAVIAMTAVLVAAAVLSLAAPHD